MVSGPHGVAARLQRDQDPTPADLASQPLQSQSDRGRVVGEVIEDSDAAAFTKKFHAATHSLKPGQRLHRIGRLDPDPGRCRNCRAGIQRIVTAGQVPFQLTDTCVVMEELDLAGGRVEQFDSPLRLTLPVHAKALDGAPATALEHALKIGILGIDDDRAVAWNRSQQVIELGFDGLEIGIDVGVVEFQVVQDRHRGPVVHELGALVKERGVVFVGLDHEHFLAGPGADAEIARYAADQKARLEICGIQNPGQHAGGRGLAVGSGNSQHGLARQVVFAQPARTRDVFDARVQDVLDGRVAPAQGIADDHQPGSCWQVGRGVAFLEMDAQCFELGAHRWVDVFVLA